MVTCACLARIWMCNDIVLCSMIAARINRTKTESGMLSKYLLSHNIRKYFKWVGKFHHVCAK